MSARDVNFLQSWVPFSCPSYLNVRYRSHPQNPPHGEHKSNPKLYGVNGLGPGRTILFLLLPYRYTGLSTSCSFKYLLVLERAMKNNRNLSLSKKRTSISQNVTDLILINTNQIGLRSLKCTLRMGSREAMACVIILVVVPLPPCCPNSEYKHVDLLSLLFMFELKYYRSILFLIFFFFYKGWQTFRSLQVHAFIILMRGGGIIDPQMKRRIIWWITTLLRRVRANELFGILPILLIRSKEKTLPNLKP